MQRGWVDDGDAEQIENIEAECSGHPDQDLERISCGSDSEGDYRCAKGEEKNARGKETCVIVRSRYWQQSRLGAQIEKQLFKTTTASMPASLAMAKNSNQAPMNAEKGPRILEMTT